MINFFRKIRKKLADDNPTSAKASAGMKTGKYLSYAIGEIVLVVVGILIALQINNWNEDRIKANREKEIIKIIYDELETNTDYITYKFNAIDSKIPYAIKLLKLTGDNAKSIAGDSLEKYTRNIFSVGSYNPFMMNLNRIKNNEEFSLIQYDSLQSMLGNYEILLDKSNLIYESIIAHKNHWELVEYQVITFGHNKYVGEDYNFKSYDELTDVRFNVNAKDILSNPKFAGLLSYQLNQMHFLRNRLEDINRDREEIRYFIEKHYDLN